MNYIYIIINLLCLFAISENAKGETFNVTPLTPAEQDYYNLSFSYAMASQPEGQPYSWKTYSSSGSITPGKIFTNKDGVPCRPFVESFVINGEKGTNSGYGCQRAGKEGWCKLKEGNMLSCALEPPATVLEGVMRDSGEALERGKAPVRSFWQKWSPF